jgi:uncharacterized protein YigA (DUF484 family)
MMQAIKNGAVSALEMQMNIVQASIDERDQKISELMGSLAKLNAEQQRAYAVRDDLADGLATLRGVKSAAERVNKPVKAD